MTEAEIKQWHKDEIEWWDKYSNIMAKQWELDDYSNKIIREDLEKESFNFLANKGGKLLDLGCGNGWLSFKFEKSGMNTLGVDFSQEQIKLAQKYKQEHGIENSNFECSDILTWDYSNYVSSFDSIYINAFLHHLPEVELEKLFEIVSNVSKKGTKIYLYEPVYFPDFYLSSIKKATLFTVVKLFSIFSFRIPSLFSFWDDYYKKARDEGYTGTSPHEAALNYTFFERILKKHSLEIEYIEPVHFKSIVYALLVNSMKKPIKMKLRKLLPFVKKVDSLLFKYIGDRGMGKKNDFLMYSIHLKRIDNDNEFN